MQRLLPDRIFPASEDAILPSCFYAVLTRFNIRAMREKVGIMSRAELAEWLRHRVPFFRDVCLRSLAAQERTPDVWLIAFDGTERDLVDDVIEMISDFPWIVPVWQDEVDGVSEDFKVKFSAAILERLQPHHSHVISSRIDNDDGLGVSFCANTEAYVQAALSRDPSLRDMWISFPVGAQMVGSDFQLYMYNSSPFVSRCTSRALLEEHPNALVNRINHNKVFEKSRTVFTPVTDRPIWLQNIHGRNVSNKSKANAMTLGPTAAIRSWFGLAEDARPVHPEAATAELV